MTVRFRNYRLLIAVMLLQVSISIGQEVAIGGRVTDPNGKPLAGASVYGSPSQCCPAKSNSAETDQMGDFHLDHAGRVIHIWKDGFASQTLVVKPGISELRVVLQNSSYVNIPECKKPLHGYRLIGTKVVFAVPKQHMKILGGRWDTDYVKYVIKPHGSSFALQLWFGPYAISMSPDDDQIFGSSDFEQKDLAIVGFGLAGQDSSGHDASGYRWRHLAFVGIGGAIYKETPSRDAALFDKIIDSACVIPVDGIH